MSRSIHETIKSLRAAYPGKRELDAACAAGDQIIVRLAKKRSIKRAVHEGRKKTKVVAEFKKRKEKLGEWNPPSLPPEKGSGE